MLEDTNVPINFKTMEAFIKTSHNFDNVNITSKLHIIKVFSKSDIAIV